MKVVARIIGALLLWVGMFLPVDWIGGITSVIDKVPPDIRWQPYTAYACIGSGLHLFGSLLAMNSWRKRLLTFGVFSSIAALCVYITLLVPWGSLVSGFTIVLIIPWIVTVNPIEKVIHLPENKEPNPAFEVLSTIRNMSKDERKGMDAMADAELLMAQLENSQGTFRAWATKFYVRYTNYDSEAARQIARRIQEIHPFTGLWMSGDAYCQMAEHVPSQQDKVELIREALKLYWRAAHLNFLHAPVWAKVAKAHMIAHNYDIASKVIERAKEINAEDPEVQQAEFRLAEEKKSERANQAVLILGGIFGGIAAEIGSTLNEMEKEGQQQFEENLRKYFKS